MPYYVKTERINFLLYAWAELWSSPSGHFSKPRHDARRKANSGQVKVGPWHKAWRWDEHVSWVSELPILLNSEWQR